MYDCGSASADRETITYFPEAKASDILNKIKAQRPVIFS